MSSKSDLDCLMSLATKFFFIWVNIWLCDSNLNRWIILWFMITVDQQRDTIGMAIATMPKQIFEFERSPSNRLKA